MLRPSGYWLLAGLVTLGVAAGGVSCGGGSQDTISSPNQAAESGISVTDPNGAPADPVVVAEGGVDSPSPGSTQAPQESSQASGSSAAATEVPLVTTNADVAPNPTDEPASPETTTNKDSSGANVTSEVNQASTFQNTGPAPSEVAPAPVSEPSAESGSSTPSVPEPAYSALSTRDLKSIPKGDYPWVVMVDPDAFIAGDVPLLVGIVIGIPHIPSLVAVASDIPAEQLQGTVSLLDGYDFSTDAVEKATILGGNSGDNQPLEFAIALEGDFDYAEILNVLEESGYWFKSGGSGLWFYESEVNGVAGFENEGFLILGNSADVGAAFDDMARTADRSDPTWAGDLGISTNSLEVAASASKNDRPLSDRVIALQGAYDFIQIREQLTVNGYSVDPAHKEGYEVWQRPGNDNVVAIVDYYGYVLLGNRYLISELFHADFSLVVPGRILRQVYETRLADVETLVSLGGGTAILGDYDLEEFRAAMQGNQRIEGAGSEAWILTDPVTSESLYAELFGDAIYTFPVSLVSESGGGGELRDDAGNPLVQAMERAGTGWLLGAWSGPRYCEKFVPKIDVERCQATALAAQTADSGAVAANWVILMDGQEAAAQASVQIENALAAKGDLLSVASVLSLGRTEEGLLDYEVTSEGNFALVKLTVTSEYAAQFLYLIISEMTRS